MPISLLKSAFLFHSCIVCTICNFTEVSMRKIYQTPQITVAKIHGSGIICSSDVVESLDTNADLEYTNSGSFLSSRTREKKMSGKKNRNI